MAGWDAGDVARAALILLAIAVLIAFVVWYLRRPRAAPTGANPNPSRITDAMWWLWQQLQLLEPSSQLGGIYANKPGYHNARSNLPAWDYSVCDNPPDWGGPGDKAAAIDWTFPNAQGGDYSTIAKYTKRLFASAQDPGDDRLDGWREFYGQADDDSYVEGWDIRWGEAATSDSSHLWHIHLSENRDQTESYDNKKKLLSVLRGELWPLSPSMGDGAVILNCPTDPARLDLFYVGPNGQVWHRWYSTGGMNAMWSGGGAAENLGGRIVVGTLTAAWKPDGSLMNIAGLGAADTGAKPPAGCGQYWGYVLGRQGDKSGWGSLTNVYGAYPAPPAAATAAAPNGGVP